MKPSTKDEIEGELLEAKGKVKEGIGRAINNPDLKIEGKAETLAGALQIKVGQVERVLDK